MQELPEAILLSSLLIVGAAGVVGGFFLRVPGVIFATAIVIAITVAVLISGHASLAEILISVVLHVCVLQVAYLTTLLAVSSWTRAGHR